MTYPSKHDQMAATPSAYIEKDQVSVQTLALTNFYTLSPPASDLDQVLIKQTVSVTGVQVVPGSNTFWLPGANPDPTGAIVVYDHLGIALTGFTTLTTVAQVQSNVPGFLVTVVWPVPGTGTPANGDTVHVFYQADVNLVGAVLVGGNLNVSGCDRTPVTGTTMTILYRSKVKPLFNL